ncbi:translesion DNA synthesis-associated protein ImuA [Paraburkholderia caballeronis]|uniref:translesion DNA synthesis-associated protein ImuA n=1 Tax=Paraburkholderia caballeronis TaxID=416943 RepID=UPI0010658201|nr:translesion DNA synthesis-associated protein ImuA [Paraburkholderia caballeronis]TDV09464.1 protein ImuA [Paraburkholderia caballeronis]TDV13735.1 protein ImuA [Paraburkholderia caballeronis]TDV22917.1 protein ImuA [Paraburkholderia caballeronis]
MAAAIQLATTLPSRLQSRVWQGDQLAHAGARALPSGHPALDALLPGAGWPAGSLTELLVEHGGIGEMRLLAPALKVLTAQSGRHALLVAPPWQPYACALHAWGIALDRVVWVRAGDGDAPWVAEQALKQDGIGAVLVWLPKARADAVRRLQVVAQDSQALAFLIRPPAARGQSSPAPLRMVCTPVPPPADGTVSRRRWMQHTALSVDIFKRRGPPLAQPLNVMLPLQDAVLPDPAASSDERPPSGTNHAVDRRHLAAVAAGGREAASAAFDVADVVAGLAGTRVPV